MKKFLFLCGILMMLPCTVVAQNFDINVEKGKRIISCTRSYGAQDQDLEFAKVMKWAIDRGEMHRDGIKAIDHFSRTLVTDFAWDDDDIKFSLSRTKACLLAFLDAEEGTWDSEELVLEYTAY